MTGMRPFLRWATMLAVFVPLALMLVGLDRVATQLWPPRYALEREVRASPAMLSMLSFGLSPLVADYLWIDAVQYCGHTLGHHVHDIVDGHIVERGLTGDDLQKAARVFHDLVVRLMDVDPLFVRAPLLGALFLTDPHADPVLGLALLERGARGHPTNWELRLWHGFYRYAILRDKEHALAELAAAARCPGSPGYVDEVRLFMETASDSLLARVFWSHASQEARTETERRILQQRLDELDAGVGGFGLEHHHGGDEDDGHHHDGHHHGHH